MFSNIRLLGLTKFHDTILFCNAVSDTEGDCLIETPDADDIVHVIETVHDNLYGKYIPFITYGSRTELRTKYNLYSRLELNKYYAETYQSFVTFVITYGQIGEQHVLDKN
jgi:hypothetical protein